MAIGDKVKDFAKKQVGILSGMWKSILGFLVFKVLIPIALIVTIYKISPGVSWYPGMPLDDWLSGLGYGGSNVNSGAICWSCGIFSIFSDVFFYMGNYFQSFLLDMARAFLFIATTVWILYEKVFKIFKGIVFDKAGLDPSFSPQSFYQDLIKKIVRVMLVLSALTVVRSADVMKYAVMPIMSVGTGTASMMMNSDVCSKMTDLKNLQYSKGDEKIYEDEVSKELFCYIASFDAMMLSGVSAGKTLVLTSSFLTPGWFMGAILTLLMFFLYITVPFQLIDIIFDIGLILIFLPFLILGYAYEIFGKFTSTAIPILKEIALKLIIFSISLTIMYLSLFKMADYYFPKPADNFSVIFPNYFVFKGDENGANFRGNSDMEREAVTFFKQCLKSSEKNDISYGYAGYSESKIRSCHRDYLSYKKLDSAGYMDLLPIIFLTIIILMIFSNMDSYIGALGGQYNGGVLGVGKTLEVMANGLITKVRKASKDGYGKLSKSWRK
jgi:hypothetical protein